VTILCYHSVDPRWASPLAVTPGAFDAHCAWLAQRRNVLSLDDAVARLDSSLCLPRGLAAITFDDGFAELYDYALPVLRRHGLAATVFLVAETLAPEGRSVDWVDTAPTWPLRTLSVDQILEMREHGVAFESHSWAHHDLTTLTEEECVADLQRSRGLLEELLRRRVRFIAFPRGRHAAHVRRAAARAGYDYAFTLPEGPEPVGPHAVPRVGVYRGNDLRTLAIKSSRWYLGLRMSRGWLPLRAALQRRARSARPRKATARPSGRDATSRRGPKPPLP
jgi:peptidoglycan/xylan/chitin deacetylase (PgdA/CDA1 family)